MTASDKASTASRRSAIVHYAIAVLAVLASMSLRAFDPILGQRAPFLFFPIAILLAARFGGWLPGLAAVVVTTLGSWFFLFNPPYSFVIVDKEDAESLAAFAISGTTISFLGSQLRDSLISKGRSERAAKQSESTVRALLDSAAQAILSVDISGNIVMINRMTELTFGYRRDELLGQSLDLLLPETARIRHHEYQKQYFANPQNRPMGLGMDLKGRHKKGFAFPVEVNLSHIDAPQGKLAIAFVTDITQRRLVEEERQKFVSLADRSLEFVSMCDLKFRPFYVNSAGMHLVGLDNLEAACGVKVHEYFFPEDQSFITNEFLPRVLREGHGTIEIRFRHFKTGKAIWMLYNVFSICDSRGDHVGWATVSVDLTERKRVERELEDSRQELQALAGRLINAEEEERKRISRELHDDLNQKIALLAFDLGSLLQSPAPLPNEVATRLRNLQARIVQLSDDIRRISHSLHPSILEDLGLTAALCELCEEISAREEIELRFQNEPAPCTVPVAVSSCLYRIAQEALHNVLKHAQASQIQVKLTKSRGGIQLCIHDNGVGFGLASSCRQGLGIVSMKERARLVHGKFAIDSQVGRGTEVTVYVPLPVEEP